MRADSRSSVTPLQVNGDVVVGGTSPMWAVYGITDRNCAQRLALALWHRLQPGATDAVIPWLAVVSDGARTVAAASRTLGSGFFYHAAQGCVVIATDPGRVLGRVGKGRLNPDYLHQFACLSASPTDTAYECVNRMAPGRTAQWIGSVASPEITVWCGAESWPPPTLEGDDVPNRYCSIFDRVVATLASDPPVVAMSSGLDSTFLAASLIRCTKPDQQITALVHRPLPEAPPPLQSRVVFDEYPRAREMAVRYGDRLRVVGVTNHERVHPLDAALASSIDSWLPAVNPHNAQWHRDFARYGASLGASHIFVGAHGNTAFSHHHAYAGWHYLVRGRPLTAVSVSSVGDVSWPRLRGAKALLRLPWQIAQRRDDVGDYARRFGIAPHPNLLSSARRIPTRSGFLHALADEEYGFAADGHPAAATVPFVDPFTAAPLLDFAAAMTPREWRRPEAQLLGPRGYARLLMQHRVPDAIRRSDQVGTQGADAWTLVRSHPQRLRDVVSHLGSTPLIGEIVDSRTLTDIVDRWHWNDAASPPPVELVGVLRIAHLAEFVDLSVSRLSNLAHVN